MTSSSNVTLLKTGTAKEKGAVRSSHVIHKYVLWIAFTDQRSKGESWRIVLDYIVALIN